MALSSSTNGFSASSGYVDVPNIIQMSTPAALTASATLTVAQLAIQRANCNAATGAGVTYTLPTATATDTAFGNAYDNSGFFFWLTNISTVAAEDATIAVGTGWTAVGNMVVASNAAATDQSAACFELRKTGTAAWTITRRA